MIRQIITDHRKLKKRTMETNWKEKNKEIREAIVDVKDTMRNLNINALSAPQIGYDLRFFCLKFGKNDLRTFINPVISNVKGLQLSEEICSSIPNKKFLRVRNNDINVVYLNPMGNIESKQLVGLAAIKFQHQLEHLEGISNNELGLEIDEDYDNASEEEKSKIVEMYLESLDLKTKSLNTSIENDEDAKSLKQAIDFSKGVMSGEIEIEHNK
jgi:peptide deformylase